MDEDEISLKDYINVIRKEKILIISIFIAAVLSGAIFSFSLPDEYLSEAKLSYISNQTIALTDAIEILKSQPIIQKTDAQLGSKREGLLMLSNLKVENIKNTNQIQIQLKGNNPEAIEKYLDGYIKVAEEELNKKSLGKSQEDYAKLENLSILYAKQKEKINAEMRIKMAEEADLEIKRLENLLAVASRFGSRDRQIDLEFKLSELRSIREGRASSTVVQQMNLSNPDLTFLNSQLTAINTKLIELENKKLESENLDIRVLELITPPTMPSAVGPKRTLNIAIAAVLGLFIGVFAAFFKNYMEGTASR